MLPGLKEYMFVQIGHSRLSAFIEAGGTRRRVLSRCIIWASVDGIVVRADEFTEAGYKSWW